MRPTKDNVLVYWPEPIRKVGSIELLETQSPYTEVEVLAKGPQCYGDFEVGDTLLVDGYRSGIVIDREKSLYLVSERICVARKEGKENE